MFTAVEKARETHTFQEMRFWQGDNVPPSPFLPPPPSLLKGSPIYVTDLNMLPWHLGATPDHVPLNWQVREGLPSRL